MAEEFVRATAKKILIRTIVEGTFVKGSDEKPNYLKTIHGEEIHRLNLMGIIVSKQQVGTIMNFIIDDGENEITLRFFENSPSTHDLQIGTPVLIIGKVREFNGEKYVAPEIVKTISPLWLKVRAKELGKVVSNVMSDEVAQKNEIESVEKEDNADVVTIFEKTDNELPFEKMISLIKELDEGDGVLIEVIVEKSTLDAPNDIIDKLLEQGEIFQNKPGKVKVL